MSIANLVQNVDNQIIQIRTKSLDVSFNELYDMYKDGDHEVGFELLWRNTVCKYMPRAVRVMHYKFLGAGQILIHPVTAGLQCQ